MNDEVPDELREMIDGETEAINPTSDEIICILKDAREYASALFDVDNSKVPTKEAYKPEEMRERLEMYEKLNWERSTQFLSSVIEAVEEEHGD